MYVSVDLDRLRQHRDDLQQQISLADEIVLILKNQHRVGMDVYGMNERLYQNQIKFAKDLAIRIRERKQLLTTTIDYLSQVKLQLSSDTFEALWQLNSDVFLSD